MNQSNPHLKSLLYTKQEIDVHKARISCLKYLWYFFFPLIPANKTFINLKFILSIYFVIYTSLGKFMNINLQLWIGSTTPSSAMTPPLTLPPTGAGRLLAITVSPLTVTFFFLANSFFFSFSSSRNLL